jgi:predicted ester cyclase
MTDETNRALARRIVEEIINRGNLAVIQEIVAPDYVEHAAPPGLPPTREGLTMFLGSFRAAFPDLHYTIEDSISEGDRVVQRVAAAGTMRGEFAGMPPSHTSASWAEIHISRWSSGKMVEHWAVVDQLGMLRQLGFVPSP